MRQTWLVLLLRGCWRYGSTTLLLGSWTMGVVLFHQQQQVRRLVYICCSRRWFILQ